MPTAGPATELRSAHRDHLDASLSQQRVRVRVAVVADDDAWRQRDNVVAVVPLLTLRLPCVATGLDRAELLQPERLFHDIEEGSRFARQINASVAVRPGAEAADLIGNVAVGGAQVAVAEGEHRIEVHGGAALRHQAGDDTRGRLVSEQLRRHLKYRLPRGAFAHAN